MMKKFVFIVCFAFALQLCMFGQGFTITGEIEGNAEGQTVSLRQYVSLKPVTVGEIASSTVKDGKFTLTGNAPIPEFSMLYVGERGPLNFFVENSNIHISVSLANIEQSKVAGSKENDYFMEFMHGVERFNAQQRHLNDSFVSLNASGMATQEAVMNLRAQFEMVANARANFMVNYVLNNSGKISTAFVVFSSLMSNLEFSQLEQVANGFDSRAGQSQWVTAISERVTAIKRTAVGQPFLDITLKTPDDKPISISDYAGKGKYVLLDFWAAWCGPCRSANPHIVRLYNQYKDRGFEIVGISLDNNKEAWIRAISEDNLTWPQMSDLKRFESEAAAMYNVGSIPYIVLLDKEGKIMLTGNVHVTTLAAKLAEIFD